VKIFRLGACLKCRGDLFYDDGDWLCLQCGLYYYNGLCGSQSRSGYAMPPQAPRIAPGRRHPFRRPAR